MWYSWLWRCQWFRVPEVVGLSATVWRLLVVEHEVPFSTLVVACHLTRRCKVLLLLPQWIWLASTPCRKIAGCDGEVSTYISILSSWNWDFWIVLWTKCICIMNKNRRYTRPCLVAICKTDNYLVYLVRSVRAVACGGYDNVGSCIWLQKLSPLTAVKILSIKRCDTDVVTTWK